MIPYYLYLYTENVNIGLYLNQYYLNCRSKIKIYMQTTDIILTDQMGINVKPTFIQMRENFARIKREFRMQIILATNQL